MSYLSVQDLKRTGDVWKRLGIEREIIITRSGKPCAIMIDVSPEECEDTLAAIRRARFSSVVSRAREKAVRNPPTEDEIDAEIRAARSERHVSS